MRAGALAGVGLTQADGELTVNLSENFTTDELACRCCRVCTVTPELLAALEALRAQAGPLVVTSGYRCQAHNKAVGGTPQSYHVRGMAADLHPTGTNAAHLALIALATPGVRGVGLSEEGGFVHVDVRATFAKWQYNNGRETPWTALSTEKRSNMSITLVPPWISPRLRPRSRTTRSRCGVAEL
jgi:zinc D-Ala-D-Ala carboxypeptidase